MTAPDNTKPAAEQDAAARTGAQESEKRISALLVHPPDVLERDDVLLLLNEIERQRAALSRAQQELLVGEERLRLAQEGADAGVWEWDLRTDKVTVTPQLERLAGKEPGTIQTYADWRRCIHPDDVERVRIERDTAIARRQPFDVAFRILLDNGETRWISGRGNAIYDEQGEALRVVGMNRDISDRKRAEAIVKEQLAEIAFYFDNAPIGLVVLDADLRYRRINRMLAEMNGFPAVDHIGRTVEEIVPAIAPQLRRLAAQILATGEAITEVEVVGETAAKPGEQRIRLERWHPLRRNDEGIIGFSVIAEDITERKRTETALRAANRRLAAHIDNSPLAIIEFDSSFHVTRWSQGAERIFGWRQEEVIGKRPSDWKFVYEDDVDSVRQLAEAMASGHPVRTMSTNRNYRKDGAVIECAWYNSTILDDEEQLRSILSLVLDVTERNQAERALRQSQFNLARAQEIGLMGNWEWDLSKQTLEWSDALYRIFGVERDFPLSYEAIEARLHPDDRAINAAKVQAALAGAEHVDFEFRIIWPDGEVRHIAQHIVPSLDATGAVVKLFGIMQDVTAHKRTAEALQQSEASLYALIENTEDLIASRDLDGRLVKFNSAFAQFIRSLCGVGVQPGVRTMDLLPDARRVYWEAVLAKVHQGAIHREEFDRQIADETRFFDLSLHPIWSKGEIIGTTEFTRDITDRKRAEEERKRLQIELAQAQKMETIGRLAGGIAHEFNNLLAVILLRTEMSLPLADPMPVLHRNLVTIYDTAQRSAELVRQLLGFARKQIIAPKVLDLNTAVEGILPMLRKLIGEAIELHWQPGVALWPIKMDKAQVDQVLINLCVNARDAIAGAGVIVIETHNTTLTHTQSGVSPAAGDYVLLTVTDSGCGMDHETLAHIFEPFFTTKEIGKGTGLGLPMIHGIIEQNHGQIEVISAPGRGATFKLYLPRHVEDAPVAAPLQSTVLPKGKGETVLLVEDEAAVLQMAVDVLEYLGYRVIAAATPADALRRLAKGQDKIDLVMTDLIMPKMNGVELAERVAALQPNVKRLFLSGYAADAIAERGVSGNTAHFLQKPYSLQTLATTLRAILDESSVVPDTKQTLKGSEKMTE